MADKSYGSNALREMVAGRKAWATIQHSLRRHRTGCHDRCAPAVLLFIDRCTNNGNMCAAALAKEQILETSLYQPVKAFLERLGFEVKGEIGACDIVAVRQGNPSALIICELKLSFNLELVLQAVDRSAACDEIWLAVRASLRGRGRETDTRVKKLCRLCGFGLLSVFQSGRVEVLVEPVAWKPRHDAKRKSRLAEEHRKRRGDPTAGGSTRVPIMTAYRQQALACACAMIQTPQRPRDLKPAAPDAAKILLRNVYGWFERIERGRYCLTETGRNALVQWQADLPPQPEVRSA